MELKSVRTGVPEEPEAAARAPQCSPEDWALERIRAGEIADFNEKFVKLDPTKPDGWDGSRRLGPNFLRRVFYDNPLGGNLPLEGVRIVGAYLSDGLMFWRGRATADVCLNQCRAEKGLYFLYATFERSLLLERSFFRDELILGRVDGIPDMRF